MEHDFIVITSDGTVEDRAFPSNWLKKALKEIESYDLVPTKIYMNQQDYQDILDWGKE